jgi:hypothetical protein
MTSTCVPTQVPKQPATCPTCHRPGRVVALHTVRACVAISLRELQSPDYHFCATSTCATVYYTVDGSVISVGQVREPVYVKAAAADATPICYCFRFRSGDLRHTNAAGRAAILATIQDGTQQGHCACDLRNPAGRCCLGDVRRLLATLQSEEST